MPPPPSSETQKKPRRNRVISIGDVNDTLGIKGRIELCLKFYNKMKDLFQCFYYPSFDLLIVPVFIFVTPNLSIYFFFVLSHIKDSVIIIFKLTYLIIIRSICSTKV